MIRIAKKDVISLIIAGVLAFGGTALSAAQWDEAVEKVEADIRQSETDIAVTESVIATERARLTGELDTLTGENAALREKLDTLKAAFDALAETERALQSEIDASASEAEAIAGVVRATAADAEKLFAESLTAAAFPERRAKLQPLISDESFPAMRNIRELIDLLLQEAEANGRVERRNGTFISEAGRAVDGEILRVGALTGIYSANDSVGFLRIDSPKNGTVGNLTAIPGDPPWHFSRMIRRYLNGETDAVPVDVSSGVIAAQALQSGDLRKWLESGGMLVWPILIIAGVALLLALERLWSLGRVPTQTDAHMENLRAMVAKGDLDACEVYCDTYRNVPTCNVLKAGVVHAGREREVMESALEEAILAQMPRLERFLSTLGVLAAVAPLLGLLGTVTGMIHTFQGITAFGTSDPRMMSGGISEALITTQLGLAVAVPIMITHHFFDRRVEKITADMEEKGTALVTALLKRSLRDATP